MSDGNMVLCRIAELTDDARDDLAALSKTVYPPAEFTFNRVMVRGVRRAIPTAGTIDLLGPPW